MRETRRSRNNNIIEVVMRFSCGVIFGILLSLIIAAAVAYFFYFRTRQDELQHAWQQTKSAGDSAWEKTKDAGDRVLAPITPDARNIEIKTPAVPAPAVSGKTE
jgi:hypothetical protein